MNAPPLRFRGTFGYGGRSYTALEQERLLRVIPGIKFKQPGEGVKDEEVGRLENYWTTHESVDLQALYEAVPDVDFSVKGMSDLDGRDVFHWAMKLVEAGKPEAPTSSMFNDHVSVVVPDIGLFKVKSVRVLENACTDDLQSFLDDNWMILAVCPQANRRPDYVLGTAALNQGDRRR